MTKLQSQDWVVRTRLWFLLRYWIVAIVFFEVARIFFLLQNFKDAKALGLHTALLTLWYGLFMDISMATYILFPVILFVILSVFIKFFRRPFIYQLYTGVLLFILLFLVVADVSIFNAWGFRLDATPLKYIKSPKEAWASIQHLPLFWGAILFMILFGFLVWINNRFIKKGAAQVNHNTPWLLSLLGLVLLMGLFIIPMRGGLQLSPINQSTVYFSSNNFANQAAINASWNLMYSLNNAVENTTNPYINMPMQEARAIVDSLYSRSGAHESFIDIKRVPLPNVVLIIWESFTNKVIDAKIEGVFITPGYNLLKNEGVYFSNIYATGDRTDKGLAGVLSGYPAQHDNSIIKTLVKAAKLPMLSKEFYKKNYETSFYYGGETEFANMKAYLMQGSFQNFVSVNDFKKSELNSKWGAHDEVVMNRMFNDLGKMKGPHFTTWLTLSSHEPYEVPVSKVIPGDDDESLFLNSLHYTDSVVYSFVQKCKSQPWWNNTIIIIVPDHGKLLPRTGMKGDEFKTSLLFLGGALSKTGILAGGIGSQVDLAATLMSQLGDRSNTFQWSRDLTDSTAKQWGFFSFNYGFGFVQSSGTLIYDNTGKMVMQTQGAIGENDIKKGKALQQVIFQDYLDK